MNKSTKTKGRRILVSAIKLLHIPPFDKMLVGKGYPDGFRWALQELSGLPKKRTEKL